MNQIKMTDKELKEMFEQYGIEMPKSYKSVNTGTLSFHITHKTFNKIVELSNKYGINRSQVVQLLIDSVEI